jgi:hypothetical protein
MRMRLHSLGVWNIACPDNCTGTERYEKDKSDWVLKILPVFKLYGQREIQGR